MSRSLGCLTTPERDGIADEQRWANRRPLARLAAVLAGRDEASEADLRHGLKAKPHPGRPKKLTESQVKKLVKMLLESPRKHGFPTDLWTLARIAELIEWKFDVSYDPSGVWHVMTRLNWSAQKPEWQARERDAEAVQTWRKRDWTRIKKRPA